MKTDKNKASYNLEHINMVLNACKDLKAISPVFLMRKFKITHEQASKDIEQILSLVRLDGDLKHVHEEHNHEDIIKLQLMLTDLINRVATIEGELYRLFATKKFK